MLPHATLVKLLNDYLMKKVIDIRWNISNEVLENEMDFKPDVVRFILRLKQLDVYSHKNKNMLEQMNIEKHLI